MISQPPLHTTQCYRSTQPPCCMNSCQSFQLAAYSRPSPLHDDRVCTNAYRSQTIPRRVNVVYQSRRTQHLLMKWTSTQPGISQILAFISMLSIISDAVPKGCTALLHSPKTVAYCLVIRSRCSFEHTLSNEPRAFARGSLMRSNEVPFSVVLHTRAWLRCRCGRLGRRARDAHVVGLVTEHQDPAVAQADNRVGVAGVH